jgi:hypothetical protein
VLRYFIDTEFIEHDKTIDLVSIGIVCEDGRELYLQSCEFSPSFASDWVKENVLSRLMLCPHRRYHGEQTVFGDHIDHLQRGQCTFQSVTSTKTGGIFHTGAHADCFWRTREEMKNELVHFITPFQHDMPELWGWITSYDFVAICQLFGTMADLPIGFPHYIHEFQQILDERGIADRELPEQEEGLHHALHDVRHLKKLWGYVVHGDAWTVRKDEL